LFYNKKPFTLEQLRKRYFRLASDDKIKNIFPVIAYNPENGHYTLKLQGKNEKPFYLEPGSILSNRPISEAFLGLQYNHLGHIGISAYANGYVGKLYTGSYSHLRFDFPRTGRSIDSGENECHIADSNVGGTNCSEFCLLVDEGEDSEKRVCCCEEYKEEDAHLESLFFWV
jgi:hypothetical protein